MAGLAFIVRALTRLIACALCASFVAASAQETSEALRQLKEENLRLQQELKRQRDLIDALNAKLDQVLKTSKESEEKVNALQNRLEQSPSGDTAEKSNFSFGNLAISGEGGVAFFHTGSDGAYPNSEFRVDEAKLFLEAPLWKNVFIFSELDLVLRESNDEFFHLGELYIDFESVLSRWGWDKWLNIRAGRFDIPFGEEYLSRDVIDNPLISHSLSDIWGVDEGVELYGAFGRVNYVLAVQNGSHPTLRDFYRDKSVAGRVGVQATPWLTLSLSGMRTGQIDVQNDELSELWFGNGFFRQIGAATNTSLFHANLVEGDVRAKWTRGHLKGAGGYVYFDDIDVTRSNQRDVYYYYAEAVQEIARKFYAASRFSQILGDEGFPIVGHGRMGKYFFTPQNLTEDLWRWSLGLGYRFSDKLVIKVEYTLERGELVPNLPRNDHDLFGVEVGFRF